ncbi:EamA family transporter [Agromyces sp. NPDC004153]
MFSAPSRGAAALLVFVALVTPEIGAAVAVLVFPALGPMGAVALRLGFSAVILLAVARPSLRGRTRADWITVAVFGLVLAAMNTAFYFAIERIPLGVAATIEVLGPLILAVVIDRRLLSWVWATLAFGGVLMLSGFGFDPDRLDPLGIVFAGVAGVCWALYILASARTGRRFARLDGLALAMGIGAITALPFGALSAGPALLRLDLLGLTLVVALLSSAVPYAAELIALRRIPASTFGVLMALVPVTAAAAGFVMLGQALTPLDLAAIALVVLASVGAVLTGPDRDRDRPARSDCGRSCPGLHSEPTEPP